MNVCSEEFRNEAEGTLHHLELISAKIPLVSLPGINVLVIHPVRVGGHPGDTTTTRAFNSISKELFQGSRRKIFCNVFIPTLFGSY